MRCEEVSFDEEGSTISTSIILAFRLKPSEIGIEEQPYKILFSR